MKTTTIEELRRRVERTEARLRRLYGVLLAAGVIVVGLVFLMGYRSGTFELETIRSRSVDVARTLKARAVRARAFHLVDERGNVVGRLHREEYSGESCVSVSGGRSEARMCAEAFEGSSLTLADTRGSVVRRLP